MDKNYLTTSDIMESLGVSRTTAIYWCQEYQLGKRIGGRWRIDPASFDLFINNREGFDAKKNKNKN